VRHCRLLSFTSLGRSAQTSLAALAQPAAEEEEPAAVVPEQYPPITIGLRSADGAVKHFKVKLSTKMDSIFQSWKSLHPDVAPHARFVFDGVALLPTATPGTAGLEDGDIVDVRVR